MVDSVIQKDMELAQEAIYYLRNHGEVVGAAKCALRHNVPMYNIAHEVQIEMCRINPQVALLNTPSRSTKAPETQSWDEDWETSSQPETKSSSACIANY